MRFDTESYSGTFFDKDRQESLVGPYDRDNRLLYTYVFTISSERIKHERSVYTFMDLIGDLGGVHEIFVIFLSIFLGPVSEFSFITKILGKLYLAKTSSA